MKNLHSHNLQQLIDDLTQELQHAIESREVAIMAGDINMMNVWDEQIQNITDYCKNNSDMLGL